MDILSFDYSIKSRLSFLLNGKFLYLLTNSQDKGMNVTRLLIIFFFVISLKGFSQRNIKTFSIKEGLSNYKAQSIFKDKDGFMWIGTQEGLNRFDGTNFKVFRNSPKDSNSISDGNIYSITQDKDGMLWIGIDGGGVNILNPKTDTIRKLFDSKTFEENHLKYVKNILIDSKGIVWVSTWGGLIRYNKQDNTYKVFKHVKDQNSISSTDVKSVVEDRDGYLWISTSNGLNKFNPKTEFFESFFIENNSGKRLDNSIRCLFFDSKKRLWVGTKGFLSLFNQEDNTFKNYTIATGNIRSNSINHIFEDHKNSLWVGTEEGLFVSSKQFDDSIEMEFIDTSVGKVEINCIFEDEYDQIWFGTRNQGLRVFETRADKIQTIALPNKFPVSKQTRFIAKGKNNSIWFGTFGNGIVNYSIDTGNYKQYLQDTDIAKNKIETLHVDSKENIWVGTYTNGLYHYDFDKDKLDHLPTKGIINCLYEHNDQTMWVGTNNGIKFYDLNKNAAHQMEYNIPNEINDDFIFFIKPDSKNNIWVGTMHNGVYKISPGVTTHEKYDYDNHSVDRYSFISFFEDNDGVYYLGTRNGGLVILFPDGKTQTITTEDGINSNTICGIVKDKNNNLWLSTAKGINLIRNTTPKTYRSFDQSDGVATYEFYRNSVYQNKDGLIFFGGTDGISFFDPYNILQETNNQKTIINGLKILNKVVSNDTIIDFKKQLTLNYRENYLNFSFSSIGFYQTEKYKYKYKMEGLDENWVNAGTEKSVSYSNLPPGNYNFKVHSTNHDGVWNTVPASLAINILPPFWQTWWFYILLFIALTSSVLIVILKREEKLIIEKENAQFKLKALRSQMNPHFIFNSLNSIQYFIVQNENRNALSYLSKFSKLVRKILENSVQERIQLSEEITFLKNYIEIESLRFDREIIHDIHIDDELLEENIEIPSMLIQPYVENAIIHGLMNIKKTETRDRKISISFIRQENVLKCTITDNGVGREISKKINERVKKNHKSLGLSITKSRLDTLNKSNKTNITVTTEDIIDRQEVKGTKIDIFVPLD